MAFFQSLPIDVKIVLGAFVAVAVLAIFSHNHKFERYYVIVLVLLAAGGVYRYQSTKPIEKAVAQEPRPAPATGQERRPIETAR
jgi:hypothetical protein